MVYLELLRGGQFKGGYDRFRHLLFDREIDDCGDEIGVGKMVRRLVGLLDDEALHDERSLIG